MLDMTVKNRCKRRCCGERYDIVLIGADLIDRTAAISNKVGSLPTILTARYIAPQAKIAALLRKRRYYSSRPPGQEENDPQEVRQAWEELSTPLLEGPYCRVNVQNAYFEQVLSDLINCCINEDGVTDPMGISRHAKEVSRKADQYFTNLLRTKSASIKSESAKSKHGA
jgi:translation initiation factor 2B subunit (eIF-2B alpha/beta/delta family)